MAQMRDLGIRTIIDLRSDTELERFNTPVPVIRDVEIRRVPVFRKEDYSPEMMAKCVEITTQFARHLIVTGKAVCLVCKRQDGGTCTVYHGQTDLSMVPELTVGFTGFHGVVLSDTQSWRGGIYRDRSPYSGLTFRRLSLPLHGQA